MGQLWQDDELKKRMAGFDDPWLSVRHAANHAGVCEKTIRCAYLSRQVQYTRVPPTDRVVLIEDTAELQLERPNLVRSATRSVSCSI